MFHACFYTFQLGLICFWFPKFCTAAVLFGVAVLHVNPESVAVALATVCLVDVCCDLTWLVVSFAWAYFLNLSVIQQCALTINQWIVSQANWTTRVLVWSVRTEHYPPKSRVTLHVRKVVSLSCCCMLLCCMVKVTKALFSSKKFLKNVIVVLLFLFDKHCLIIE